MSTCRWLIFSFASRSFKGARPQSYLDPLSTEQECEVFRSRLFPSIATADRNDSGMNDECIQPGGRFPIRHS
jgi:hypothetical protein